MVQKEYNTQNIYSQKFPFSLFSTEYIKFTQLDKSWTVVGYSLLELNLWDQSAAASASQIALCS